ncbi:MAG: hypothetical protein U9R14_04245 [Patescibacteria group bacterium]|nr:hypothetical protein [Patescibacteria group bacterium]
MKNKTKKSLIAAFLYLFFGAINIFNMKFFNSHGYMPITENFRYILFPVNFIVSAIAKFSYNFFPLLLRPVMDGPFMGISIIGVIGFLLTLSYYYLLVHFLFLFVMFLKRNLKNK